MFPWWCILRLYPCEMCHLYDEPNKILHVQGKNRDHNRAISMGQKDVVDLRLLKNDKAVLNLSTSKFVLKTCKFLIYSLT